MDLQILVNAIKLDKCVLLLGPEIISTETGQNYQEELINYLFKIDNENSEGKSIKKFYNDDDFFLFNQTDDIPGKFNVYCNILNFYQDIKPSEIILRKIAQIPISLIISMNPDKFIYEVLKKNGIEAEYSYFDKNLPVEFSKNPTKINPLVFNFMGDIDNMDSLVLTHQDLFDFLEGALFKSRLPKNFRDIISKAQSFIFLGFKFDKWYVQLLMRLLDPPNKKFSINKVISDDAKTFYSEQFKLNFTELSNEDFIDKLIEELNKNKVPLRQLSEEISDDVLKIKLYIEKARIEEACTALKTMFPEKVDEIIMQLSRYNSINEQQKNGVIDIKDYNLTLQQLKFALLEMIK